jgi:acyl dehydratase
MALDLARLGRWTEERVVTVDAEHARAYAAATNDDNPWHRDGRLAPPVYGVALAVQVWPAELERVLGGELERLGSVHGEHDLRIARPIAPGTTLRIRSAVVGIQVKSSGTACVAKTETRDEQGPVSEQYAVNFLRGYDAGASLGETMPQFRLTDEVRTRAPLAQVTYPVDTDQPLRYADASGDRGTYHVSDEAARELGFPRIIVHGVCTLAFASRAVVDAACAGDPRRLTRLAARFSAPLLPGQDVTTTLWPNGGTEGRARLAFEMRDAAGTAVLTNGLAEVAQQ